MPPRARTSLRPSGDAATCCTNCRTTRQNSPPEVFPTQFSILLCRHWSARAVLVKLDHVLSTPTLTCRHLHFGEAHVTRSAQQTWRADGGTVRSARNQLICYS